MTKSTIRRAAVMMGLVLGLGSIAIAPAMAEDWHHQGRGGGPGYNDHYDRGDHWERERMQRERWQWRHHYAPPPVVVVPPPQPMYYYAPPPVVATQPYGLNVILPINIR